MSRGVVYIATGEKYINEALISAVSLKDKMPDLPITLFSSEEVNSQVFNEVILIKNYQSKCGIIGKINKVAYISQTPYEETLFLDTDTYICSNFLELFSMLKDFDIAVAHAPNRIAYQVANVPESFPEMNTGVILFKHSQSVNIFFHEWLNIYNRDMINKEITLGKHLHDQPAFREALYHSNLRVATLTPEYNCRFVMPGYVDKEVKILHGRHTDLPAIAKKINSYKKQRIFLLNKLTKSLYLWWR